jgi:hypothetical protein
MLLLALTPCTKLFPHQLGVVNLFSGAIAKVSEQQPSEVVSFSYWLIKLWFHTERKLTVVLIIPSSWGFPTGPMRHQDCFLAPLPRRKRISTRGVSDFQSFLRCYCFA